MATLESHLEKLGVFRFFSSPRVRQETSTRSHGLELSNPDRVIPDVASTDRKGYHRPLKGGALAHRVTIGTVQKTQSSSVEVILQQLRALGLQ